MARSEAVLSLASKTAQYHAPLLSVHVVPRLVPVLTDTIDDSVELGPSLVIPVTLNANWTLETLCVICASAWAVRSPLNAVPVFCTKPSLMTLMSLLPEPSLAKRTAQ